MNLEARFAPRLAAYLALGAVLFFQPLLTLPSGSTLAGILLLAAALLLGLTEKPRPLPDRSTSLVLAGAALLLGLVLPMAWWPGLFLLVLGGLAVLLPLPWTARLSASSRRAGGHYLLGTLLSPLVVHAMAMLEVWNPCGWAAMAWARLLGIQVSVLSGNLVLTTPLESQPFMLAPEWTGLLVQALVAGLALPWFFAHGWRRSVALYPLFLILEQLLFGLFFLLSCLVGAMLDFYELPWHPLLHLLAGLPALLLASWMAGPSPEPEAIPMPDQAPALSRSVTAPPMTFGLAILSCALLLAGLFWQDGGTRKAGRVLIDDGHSDWEWVETPMTPNVFGSKTTYNFHGLGRMLAGYYDLKVTSSPLSPEALADVDVLILKTPTRPYDSTEVAAVMDFVHAGGGLYLISDHTNVFGMSTWMNEIADRFGLHFNYDAVFALWSRSDQVWRSHGPLPHPAVQVLPYYHFLTSCSIRPGLGTRIVMAGAEAGSSLVCYHQSNFFNMHPPRAEHRFGSLPQVVAAKFGRGRVLGFTDSTTYSNFAMFWPGRLEQLLGAIDYLNRKNPIISLRIVLLVLGAAGMAWSARRRMPCHAWLPALTLAALVALPLLRLQRQAAYPQVSPRQLLPVISLDTDLSDVRFPLEEKLEADDPLNLETFFIWLHRSGRIPVLVDGVIPQSSSLHILLNPPQVPDSTRQAAMQAFMEGGGTLLVATRPSQYSAGMNPWLERNGLRFGARLVQQQTIHLAGEADSLWVDEALSVEGGTPFAWESTGQALATEISVGRGKLIVSGLADCFNNLHLGRYDSVPSGLTLECLRIYYRHVGITLDPQVQVLEEEGRPGI